MSNAIYVYMSTLFFTIGQRFENKDKGATSVEYGLILAGIAVAVGIAAVTLGGQITALFKSVGTSITTKPTP